MASEIRKKISGKYEPRFGQTAVTMGFVSEAQLADALRSQSEEDRSGRSHRLLGAILFEKEWMTGDQIEIVLNSLLKSMRTEAEKKQ